MTIDQRAAGFNYGIGWAAHRTPLIFDQGISLAQRLNQQATEASRAAWAVEMRLRAVRLAETEKEKAMPLQHSLILCVATISLVAAE